MHTESSAVSQCQFSPYGRSKCLLHQEDSLRRLNPCWQCEHNLLLCTIWFKTLVGYFWSAAGFGICSYRFTASISNSSKNMQKSLTERLIYVWRCVQKPATWPKQSKCANQSIRFHDVLNERHAKCWIKLILFLDFVMHSHMQMSVTLVHCLPTPHNVSYHSGSSHFIPDFTSSHSWLS